MTQLGNKRMSRYDPAKELYLSDPAQNVRSLNCT